MTQFIDRRDPWGNRYSLWVVVAMAFVAPVCIWALPQIRFENQIDQWLPETDTDRVVQKWAHQQFPIDQQLILTWDGSSLHDSRIDQLITELKGESDGQGHQRGGLPYVSTIIDPRDVLRDIQKSEIEPSEAVRRIQGSLIGTGPLRVRLTEAGRSVLRKTKREIEVATRAKFGINVIVSDATTDAATSLSIPTVSDDRSAGTPGAPMVLMADGTTSEKHSADHDFQLTWDGLRFGSESTIAVAKWLVEYAPHRGDQARLIESAFFVPGTPVALILGISEAGRADKSEAIAAIRMACHRAGISRESLHLAGNTVVAAGLDHQVGDAIWNRSAPPEQLHRRSVILNSMLVAAIAAFVLVRNTRLALMMVFVSVFTVSVTFSIIPVTGGSMNFLSIGLPTLIALMSMSGCLYIVNRWKLIVADDVCGSVSETVALSKNPSRIASLIAAIGCVSLCTSLISPVREFGFYAAAGAILSLLMVAYALPSFMQMWIAAPSHGNHFDRIGWQFFGQLLTTRPIIQSLIVTSLFLGCGLGLRALQPEVSTSSLFPPTSAIIRDSAFIDRNLAGTLPIDLIIRFDEQSQKTISFLDRMETVRNVQQAMRGNSEVSGCLSLADFLPVNDRLPDDASFIQRSKFNKRATAIQQRIHDGEISLARSFYTVAEQRQDLEHAGDGKLNLPGDELWRITSFIHAPVGEQYDAILTNLHEQAQDILKVQAGSHHFITGSLPLLAKMKSAVTKNLVGCAGLAAFLIVAVSAMTLRSITAGGLILIGAALPTAAVFGIYSQLGHSIDLGLLIAAPASLFLGAEGTLHCLGCFRRNLKLGMDRRTAVIDSLIHCGPTLWQSRGIMVLGLLPLMSVDFPVMHRFATMMVSICGSAIVCNLTLIPQLLAGPLGTLFEPKRVADGKSVLAVKSEPIVQPVLPVVIAETPAIPDPHIKPLAPTPKKRRSSRRDSDAS